MDSNPRPQRKICENHSVLYLSVFSLFPNQDDKENFSSMVHLTTCEEDRFPVMWFLTQLKKKKKKTLLLKWKHLNCLSIP